MAFTYKEIDNANAVNMCMNDLISYSECGKVPKCIWDMIMGRCNGSLKVDIRQGFTKKDIIKDISDQDYAMVDVLHQTSDSHNKEGTALHFSSTNKRDIQSKLGHIDNRQPGCKDVKMEDKLHTENSLESTTVRILSYIKDSINKKTTLKNIHSGVRKAVEARSRKLKLPSKGTLLWWYLIIRVLCGFQGVSMIHLAKQHRSDCSPILTDSKPYGEEFKQIECEISTCESVSSVVFERADLHTSEQWTPVFKGIDKTYYYALHTNTGYTLAKRFYYTALPNKHVLYITPFNPKDQGKWRCVVYQNDLVNRESKASIVNIYVTPKQEKLQARPSSAILEMGQTQAFTCKTKGIHPKPDVIWTVNGAEKQGGVSADYRRRDRLWIVKNTIELSFDKVGISFLNCIVKTKDRDPWLKTVIHVDIKETVKVTYPKTNERKVLTNAYAKFELNCSGTGYKPHIVWEKDGISVIDTDERFTISQTCNASACESSLTYTQDDQHSLCADKDNYIGAYNCIIANGHPCKSKKASPYLLVAVSHETCQREPHLWKMFGFAIVIVLSLISVVIFVCVKTH